jgi:DNA-binding cell septation regulator SpoVG
VVLEPVDLYIYALGIYLRADEIYTHDGEFREIIHNIHYVDREWKNIYEHIQQDLKEFIKPIQEECKTYYDKYGKDKKIVLPDGVP